MIRWEMIEPSCVTSHDFTGLVIWDICESAFDYFLQVGEGAFVMGIVATPHQSIYTGYSAICQAHGIIPEGGIALALEIFAGFHG